VIASHLAPVVHAGPWDPAKTRRRSVQTWVLLLLSCSRPLCRSPSPQDCVLVVCVMCARTCVGCGSFFLVAGRQIPSEESGGL